MHPSISSYSVAQTPANKAICDRLADEITRGLPQATGKVRHGGPVWFVDGNPVAGYWVRKKCVQLLFWSGQSFDEPGRRSKGKFKAADAHYTGMEEINSIGIQHWLAKAAIIQWDYKNIVKRKGRLEKIGAW